MATPAEHEMFRVKFSRVDGTVVVLPTGELDLDTAAVMGQALTSVIDDQGSLSVRVDLGDMTFIDSTGLSVLVDALNRICAKGGELTLANPTPSVLRVFEGVGFPKIFDIVSAEGPTLPGVGCTEDSARVASKEHPVQA